MSDDFFKLPLEEQSALLNRAGDHFDMPDMIIEKDLWLCWLLDRVFELPIQIAFKGGTSLSKVFGLIKRFSEDCDITIDYRHFKPELDLKRTSRSQFKKINDQLKEQLKVYISETALPYLNEEVLKIFPKEKFEITLSDNGEQLRFYYPSIIGTLNGYLRDHILIEFGARNTTEPCEKHQVAPYLAQVSLSDFALPKPMVNTLSPIRTFWEKATLIHAECHRDRFDRAPERLSRHWYDLVLLGAVED